MTYPAHCNLSLCGSLGLQWWLRAAALLDADRRLDFRLRRDAQEEMWTLFEQMHIGDCSRQQVPA